MTIKTPRALVVYESMFGNTQEVARSVANGLEVEGLLVTLVDVGSAPPQLPDVELLVVGAPTHAFSLSRPSTRADAVRQGAPASRATFGLREWLSTVQLPSGGEPPTVAAFDTRVSKVRHLPKAAAPRAARLAARRGLPRASKPASFVVAGMPGPLLDGELERAAAWGRELAGDSQNLVAARAARAARGGSGGR